MMSPTILLIEDNPGDAALVTEAINHIKGGVLITTALDGQLGLEKLRSMAAENKPPDLIICNFNLPMRTGAQVLSEVERDVELKLIPFIMLTSSSRDTEREACAGAKAYLIKGSTWVDVLAIAKQIVAFLPAGPGNVMK